MLDKTRQWLEAGQLFVVASIEVRGFNAFNDHYGPARGDAVIRFVADTLRRHCDPARDFAAYLGGDNFVALLRSIDWFERCEAMLTECESQAPGFYDAEDRRKGGIELYNHLGERLFSPIFSLSIGVVQADSHRYRDHHQLLKTARELQDRAAPSIGAIFVEGLGQPVMGGVFGLVCH